MEKDRRPELVIGLVGAVGTPLAKVAALLEEKLTAMRYSTVSIRLSDTLGELGPLAGLGPLSESPTESDRLDWLMKAGTLVCDHLGRGDAIAGLAAGAVFKERPPIGDGGLGDRAYILRSLKRVAEVETLRRVYADHFVLLGVWMARDARVREVARRIAESDGSMKLELARSAAERLVTNDESEPNARFGQDVRNTFPMSDYFVDATSAADLARGLDRFVKLLFGDPFVTPAHDETMMFHASAASLRSSALGRQVGAAIAAPDGGSLLATGMNEVPKAGGGHYAEEDAGDARDFVLGKDSNYEHKRAIVRQVMASLKDAGWLSDARAATSVEDLAAQALERGGPVSRTRLVHLTEFGRDVHAEMSAIVEAARRGVAVAGAELFCTTFPCHNCAKHIIAAGIGRVVYLEPYEKSVASELHFDAIALDARDHHDPSRVAFVPFVGVAPRRYGAWFAMKERKDNYGKVLQFRPPEAFPWFGPGDLGYLDRELSLLDTVRDLLDDQQIVDRHGAEHGKR